MKVGILTYHDAINQGAFLQAYALKKLIESMGMECEYLNYHSLRKTYRKYKRFLITKQPYGLLFNIRKIGRIRDVQKKYLNEKNIGEGAYDSIVVGSDEVWSYRQPSIDFKPYFFSIGLNARKIIAYAPSFGVMTVESPFPEIYSGGLKRFDYLSARDFYTQSVVRAVCKRNVPLVLDPTLLYDFKEEESCPESDFFLVYGYKFEDSMVKEIRGVAQKYGKKLIAIDFYHAWCDKCVVVQPFEFLAYFKKADFVFTNMFHGTLFSIKYGKQFVISSNNHKIDTIVKMFELGSRVVDEHTDYDRFVNERINYQRIQEILSLKKEESVRFLKEALFGLKRVN